MKQLFLIITLLLLTVTVSAGDVSREQAREKAQRFLKQKSIDRTLVAVETRQARRRSGAQETDCFYVFNVGQDEGFIIVSGDDRAPDILGYTDHGTFDADNLPPNFASWLQVYVKEIRFMRESNVQPVAKTRSVKKAFAPVATLLTCHWGQDYPYNIGYPEVNGQTCITGCVATALAQVLYYYKNPATTTEIPGYVTTRHGIKMETLPPTTFDWGNMTDEYNNKSSETQKEAVAKLMFYCSTAVKANLDPSGTGAYSYQQLVALRNYFGFVKSAKQKTRGNLTQWENMLYEEVSAGRPVLYSGNGGDGQPGHAFVLDGHDGMYFHFNWGWKGVCDGNFAITALNPSGYDFNHNQDAIVGISLTETEPPVYNEDVRLTTETFYPYNFKDYDKYYISSTDNGVNQYWGVKFGCKISSKLKGTYDIDNNYAIYKDGVFMEYLYPFEVENPKFGINYEMAEDDYFPYGYEELLTLPHGHNDGYGNVTYGKSFQEPGTYLIIAVSRLHGDQGWKLNHGSKEKFLKCVIDKDHVLHLYQGAPSDFPEDLKDPVDPTPEVSDSDREALTTIYDKLKTAVEPLQTIVNYNRLAIKSMNTQIASDLSDLQAIGDQINAIEIKLADSNLAEGQKTDYGIQLSVLKTQKTDCENQLMKLTKDLATVDKSNQDLQEQISAMLSTISIQTAAISGITTKVALEASQQKAEELKTQADGFNPTAIAKEITTIESAYGEISLENLKSSLNALDEAIETAINEASGIDAVIPADDEIDRCYDLYGRPVDKNYKGIIVVVQKNGQVLLRSSAKR